MDGHLAKFCQNNRSGSTVSPSGNENSAQGSQKNTDGPLGQATFLKPLDYVSDSSQGVLEKSFEHEDSVPGNKRAASSSLSINSENVLLATDTITTQNKKPTKKKRKNQEEVGILETENILREKLSLLKPMIDDGRSKEDKGENKEYPLNFEAFTKFLVNAYGKNNMEIKELCEQENLDTSDIVTMIYSAYPHLNDRALKNRCTRIRNRLQNIITGGISTDDFLSSDQDSTY
ncbi:hypothetical protein ABEB36_003802 [Hypothenemus hampei]|uniref:BEN domain-containing protein n=1 Tax=Hypothenemus hampei TaxID=57062 RepID=A0ABD1F4B0_HYPHA